MRILILHNAYAQRGGEDVVVEAEHAALRARGHEVHALIRDSQVLHAARLQGAAETLLTLHNPKAAAELSSALASFRPDVVHIHNLFPRWGLAALRVLRAHALPVVQTLHNFRWLCAPATFLRDGRDCRLCQHGNFVPAVRYACMHHGRVVSAAYAAALAENRRSELAERAITRFLCVSEFVRRAHQEAGFAPERLRVKGHFLRSTKGAATAGKGSLLFVGRFSPEKGLSVLLEAMRYLPGVMLHVVGDGPEREALQASLGARQSQVVFLGRLARAALWQAMQDSSVCVVPSVGSETFGLSVLEAFACARPVVVSDAGGLPELVRSGEDGWVVPRNDAHALADRIRWLLEHPDEAQRFGLRGLNKVQTQYGEDANMQALEQLYREATDERVRVPGRAPTRRA